MKYSAVKHLIRTAVWRVQTDAFIKLSISLMAVLAFQQIFTGKSSSPILCWIWLWICKVKCWHCKIVFSVSLNKCFVSKIWSNAQKDVTEHYRFKFPLWFMGIYGIFLHPWLLFQCRNICETSASWGLCAFYLIYSIFLLAVLKMGGWWSQRHVFGWIMVVFVSFF